MHRGRPVSEGPDVAVERHRHVTAAPEPAPDVGAPAVDPAAAAPEALREDTDRLGPLRDDVADLCQGDGAAVARVVRRHRGGHPGRVREDRATPAPDRLQEDAVRAVAGGGHRAGVAQPDGPAVTARAIGPPERDPERAGARDVCLAPAAPHALGEQPDRARAVRRDVAGDRALDVTAVEPGAALGAQPERHGVPAPADPQPHGAPAAADALEQEAM